MPDTMMWSAVMGMYNALEKLRSSSRYTTVADAYGWPADLDDESILARLVALNTERAAEEARGMGDHRSDGQGSG